MHARGLLNKMGDYLSLYPVSHSGREHPTEWKVNKDSGSTVSGWVLLQAPVDVADGSSEEENDDDYDKGSTSVNVLL